MLYPNSSPRPRLLVRQEKTRVVLLVYPKGGGTMRLVRQLEVAVLGLMKTRQKCSKGVSRQCRSVSGFLTIVYGCFVLLCCFWYPSCCTLRFECLLPMCTVLGRHQLAFTHTFLGSGVFPPNVAQVEENRYPGMFDMFPDLTYDIVPSFHDAVANAVYARCRRGRIGSLGLALYCYHTSVFCLFCVTIILTSRPAGLTGSGATPCR